MTLESLESILLQSPKADHFAKLQYFLFFYNTSGAQLHIFLKNQENRPLIFRLCALPQKFFQLHTTQKEFHFFKVILLCSMFIFLWNLSSSGTGS